MLVYSSKIEFKTEVDFFIIEKEKPPKRFFLPSNILSNIFNLNRMNFDSSCKAYQPFLL